MNQKRYSPSQLRFSIVKLHEKSGHEAVVRFLNKVNKNDVLNFLSDDSPLDRFKDMIGRLSGYKKAYQDIQAERYRINADSLTSYNGLKNYLKGHTAAETLSYFDRVLKKYFHPDDRQDIESRLHDLIAREIESPENSHTADSSDFMSKAPETPVQAENIPKLSGYSKVYVNLARLANELNMIGIFRLWLLAHEVNRLGKGDGNLSVSTVRELYCQHIGSQSTFYDHLSNGNGLFWNYDKVNGRLWITGQAKLSQALTSRLPENRLQHYRGNNAIGAYKPVVMSIFGTQAGFMQNVFAGWIRLRQAYNERTKTGDSGDSVTIANETLATLFDVDIRTIQRWKVSCHSRSNYAVKAPVTDSKNHINPDTPSHAVRHENGDTVYQIANSYTAPETVDFHAHRGKASKVKQASYQAMEYTESSDNRRNETIPDVAERLSHERLYFVGDIESNFDRVENRLRKQNSDTFKPRNILLKAHQTIGVWEVFTGHEQRVISHVLVRE